MSIFSINQSAIQDRIVRESERKLITSISRSQAFQLERLNRFPKRIKLGSRSVGWRLSELMQWVHSGGGLSEQLAQGAGYEG
ncbi:MULTISPECIES: AlpA family phage regulatory protein [Shewanella]|uniref:AlpA family phage regulatory protein n=1 Tax=Shewanella TaxID=22 RepID=UPI000DFA7D02|nr:MULTISPECIES: AlpA family phage regulatory protein [Shewanella]MCU8009582.1 AlpA family transcriptional regulator [Shewanella sp. SM87]SUI41845.1 Predicted transcriptional regulator [Shewanella baltica]